MEIVDSTGYVIRVGKIESVVIFAKNGQTEVFFEQDGIRLAKVSEEPGDEYKKYIRVACVDGSFYAFFDSITITSDIPFLRKTGKRVIFLRKTGKRIIVGIDGSVRVKILNYIG